VTVRVIIPIHGYREAGQKYQVNFPGRCVYCGGPAETQLRVNLLSDAQAQRQRVWYSTTLQLPYCIEHATLSDQYKKQYEKLMSIIVIAVILIAIVGWNLTNLPATTFLLPVMLGVAALFLLHRMLLKLFPKFREIPPLFREGALGVTIKLIVSKDAATGLELKFSNEEYAAKFAQLNNAHLDTK